MNDDQQARFDQQYAKHVSALKLQGMARTTIESYSFALRRISAYFDRCPDDLTPDELARYFIHLIDTKSWSLIRVDRNGIRCYYKHVLGQALPWMKLLRPPVVKTLPDILTREEIARIIRRTEQPRFKAYWCVTYSMGLRLREALSLTVADIDSQRMFLHVRNAKGNRDRFVVMPELALQVLRSVWKTHRHPTLIFPSRQTQQGAIATNYMDAGTTQRAFAEVLRQCGIHKKVSIHSLRHSYATHLIEAGLNLRNVQEQLGHASPDTTAHYIRMTEVVKHDCRTRVNEIVEPLAALFNEEK